MPTEAAAEAAALKRELKISVVVLGAFVGLMWALELLDLTLLGGGLDAGGIEPRTAEGLWGILFAPFLHAGLGHLVANTVPFLVLGWLVLARETWHFPVVTGVTMLVAGAGVWLLGGAGTVHLGASSLVFGYFGYLLLAGWYERSIATMALSIGVFVFWGWMIFGVLPGQDGVSWEGHLFGFLAGVLCARFLARRRAPRKG